MYTGSVTAGDARQLNESAHNASRPPNTYESTPGVQPVVFVVVVVVLAVLWRLCGCLCNRLCKFPCRLSSSNRRYPKARIFPDLTIDREHLLHIRRQRYRHIAATSAPARAPLAPTPLAPPANSSEPTTEIPDETFT